MAGLLQNFVFGKGLKRKNNKLLNHYKSGPPKLP